MCTIAHSTFIGRIPPALFSQQLKCIWHEGVKHPCCCIELMSHMFRCLLVSYETSSSLLTLQHSRDSRWQLGDTHTYSTHKHIFKHSVLMGHDVLLTLQSEDSRGILGAAMVTCPLTCLWETAPRLNPRLPFSDSAYLTGVCVCACVLCQHVSYAYRSLLRISVQLYVSSVSSGLDMKSSSIKTHTYSTKDM